MASRLTKLCTKILLQSSVVLIFLSVSTSAEVTVEATRCYWCGPLAEQVHRSQRAPSCDVFDQHQTVCDKGYTHCAVVATSPPYAESRLCVKFYQDECYSLYCNSTKTWRMVCACRGDLCNGFHTERETKAFAVLPKSQAKTKTRNTRSLISGFVSVKTNTPAENNTIIIINNEMTSNETTNSLQSDQPIEDQTNTSESTSTNDIPKNIEDNIIIEHGTIETSAHALINKAENENTHNNPSNENTHPKHAEMDKQMAKDLNTSSNVVENKTTEYIKTDKSIDNTKMHTTKEMLGNTQNVMKLTTIEIEVTMITPKLPPAEALQQNVTPTKAVEITTMGTIAINTDTTHVTETTTLSAMKDHNEVNHQMKKNFGTQNLPHQTFIVISSALLCLVYF